MKHTSIKVIFALILALSLPAQADEHDTPFAAQARAWLLANPEVLLEAMEVLKARQETVASSQDIERINRNSDALFADPGDGYLGGSDVVAVEFFDYQCGYCKRQLAAVEAFIEENPGKRIILKEFPILGPASEMAARAALAARLIAGNDTYVAVHNGLLKHQGRLDNAVIDQILTEAGLHPADVRARMDDSEITDKIEANRVLAARVGVTGTPGFVMRGSIARGLLSRQALEQMALGQQGEVN